MWQVPSHSQGTPCLDKDTDRLHSTRQIYLVNVFSEFIVTLISLILIVLSDHKILNLTFTHTHAQELISGHWHRKTRQCKRSDKGRNFHFHFFEYILSRSQVDPAILPSHLLQTAICVVHNPTKLCCTQSGPSRTGPNCRCCRLLADPSAFLYSIFSTYSGWATLYTMWVNWPQLLGLPRFTPIGPSDLLYSIFSYCGQTLTERTELPQLPPFTRSVRLRFSSISSCLPSRSGPATHLQYISKHKKKNCIFWNILGLRLNLSDANKNLKKACRFFSNFFESAPFKKNLSNLLYMCVLILVMLYYSV